MVKLLPIIAALSQLLLAWSFPDRSSDILTTTACPNPRLSFPVRVDALYLYTVAPRGESTVNLKSVERAIASSVSSSLDNCDAGGKPTHVVELQGEGRHEIISQEYVGDLCLQEDTCILVRGITSILTTRESALLESETNVLIRRAFDDWDYLTQASNIDNVSLALMLGVNVVLPSFDDDILDKTSGGKQSQSLRIGAIAAIASVAFTAVVLYLLYSKGDFTVDGERKNKMMFLQARRRRFFQDLDDQNSLPMGWMVTNSNGTSLPSSLPKEGTVTWSVSDLTSDAESIKSNLPLERIVEAEDEMSSDEEAAMRDKSYAASSPIYSPRSPIKIADLEFIASWRENPDSPEEGVKDLDFSYEGRKTVLWEQEDANQEASNGGTPSTEGTELLGCSFVDENGMVHNELLEITDDEEMGVIIPVQSDDETKYHTPTALEAAAKGDAESDFASPAELSDDGTTEDNKTPKSTDTGMHSPLLLWAQAAVQKLVGDN